MNPLVFLCAALAGGVGAGLRYLVDLGVARLVGTRYPWGVLVINLTGSFVLGVVTSGFPGAAFIVGAGLLGGYTTFSTASVETVRLARLGLRLAGLALIVMVVGWVGAAALGFWVASR